MDQSKIKFKVSRAFQYFRGTIFLSCCTRNLSMRWEFWILLILVSEMTLLRSLLQRQLVPSPSRRGMDRRVGKFTKNAGCIRQNICRHSVITRALLYDCSISSRFCLGVFLLSQGRWTLCSKTTGMYIIWKNKNRYFYRWFSIQLVGLEGWRLL